MPTIVIEVEGGCVQDVHGLTRDWDYVVADWDQVEIGESDFTEDELDEMISKAKAGEL